METPRKWAMALAFALATTSGWAMTGDERQAPADAPVFMATINGQIFKESSVRDAARKGLAQGLTLIDMVNGLAFSGGALSEIIGGALDAGLAPEAIAPVLLASGYLPEQVVPAAVTAGAPIAAIDRFAQQLDIEPNQTRTIFRQRIQAVGHEWPVGTAGSPATGELPTQQGSGVSGFGELSAMAKVSGFSTLVPLQGGIGGNARSCLIGAAAP